MVSRFVGVAVSAVMTVCAWAQQPEAPAAPTPAAPTTVTETPSAPEITVISTGAEPRQELRMAPAVGASQTATLKMKLSMTMSMAGQEFPSQSMPGMILTMVLKVASISPEGDIAYEMNIADCGVDAGDDMMVQAMKAALEPLKQLSGSGVVTTRGINKSVKLNIPPGVPAGAMEAMRGMTEQIGQVGMPLPAEAVGAGAQWTVKSKLKSQGLLIAQTMTYTLKEVKDGAAVLETKVEQTAEPQKVTSADIPEGVTVDLKTLTSSGTGSTEYPLAGLMPRKADMKTKTDMTMSVSQGAGEASEMKQAVSVELSVTSENTKAEPAK